MSQSGARRAPIGRYFETTLPASSPVHRTDAVQAVEAESTSGGKVSRSTEERFWLPGRRPRRRRIQTDRERERERDGKGILGETSRGRECDEERAEAGRDYRESK